MVHGFDIALSDADAFGRAFERNRRTLESLDIPLIRIATNYREIARASWGYVFAGALIAAIVNLRNQFGTCIVGSSEPYDALAIPWGSTPMTDYLLGSNEFNVMHDGASHSRLEKVAEIADWDAGMNDLRVCYLADRKDENCGVCEKCLRTQLNFLVAGRSIPSSFPPVSNLDKRVVWIRLTSPAVRSEWRQIYKRALQNECQETWVRSVGRLLRRQSVLDRLMHLPRSAQPFAERLVRRLY